MRYQQPYGISDLDAPYINGDPSIGRAGSIPPAAAFEHPMRELASVIEYAGLTPNESDLEQLWKAIQIAPWIQEYAEDTGTENNLIAAIDPVPPSLIVGTTVRIKVKVTNTGPSTLSLNTFGTYSIRKANSTVLEAGDLVVGQIATLIWTGSQWQIVNYLGSSAPINENTYEIDIPYAADSGTADHVIANFSPDIETAAAGMAILVKAAYTNLGATDIVCDAQAAKAIVRPNGTPLVAGDIVAGQMMFLLFDGTSWQLTNPIKWFTDTGGGGGATGAFVPGAIYLWPTETAPAGTLECNGSAVSRTQYSRLFGIISTMYGAGNGTTTFNLPDYRGMFPRGWDHGSSRDPDRGTRTDRGDGTVGDHIGTRQLASIKVSDIGGTVMLDDVTLLTGYAGLPPTMEAQFPNNYEPGVRFVGNGNEQVSFVTNYPFVARRITGSLSAIDGGNETRPLNVNTMYIIGY